MNPLESFLKDVRGICGISGGYRYAKILEVHIENAAAK